MDAAEETHPNHVEPFAGFWEETEKGRHIFVGKNTETVMVNFRRVEDNNGVEQRITLDNQQAICLMYLLQEVLYKPENETKS